MAKKGMARPGWTKLHPKNEAFVPELQGKAKNGKAKANPIVDGTRGANQKVWHDQRPISQAHGIIDTDLARDNLENDIPYADLQDL